MTVKLRSWIIAGIIVLVIVIGLIVVWRFNGTGFGGYDKVTKEYTPAGQLTKTTTESQPGKTVWDWLGLLAALAIPVVVGFGVAWFTTQQGKVSDEENRDNQREAALQAYIDKISELLLHEHLGESPGNPQVETIARARTATVLRTLDPVRRGSLIRFLSQAGILAKCTENDLRGIDLHGADLTWVNLSNINLSSADLRGAYLSHANLYGVSLIKANLCGANLFDANLSGADLTIADLKKAFLNVADLRGANLSKAKVATKQLDTAKSLKGATMPDGSKHP